MTIVTDPDLGKTASILRLSRPDLACHCLHPRQLITVAPSVGGQPAASGMSTPCDCARFSTASVQTAAARQYLLEYVHKAPTYVVRRRDCVIIHERSEYGVIETPVDL